MEVEGPEDKNKNSKMPIWAGKFWVLQYFLIWRFFAFITVFTFLVKDCVARLLQARGNTVLKYDMPAGTLSLWDDLKPEGVFQGVIFGANEFSALLYWLNEQQ